jgi:hypothetical protein
MPIISTLVSNVLAALGSAVLDQPARDTARATSETARRPRPRRERAGSRTPRAGTAAARAVPEASVRSKAADGAPLRSSGAATKAKAPAAPAAAAVPTARPLDELVAAAGTGTLPTPQPLHPDGTDNAPPMDVLPSLFRSAAQTIDATYQVPDATALACLLGAASFAVQRAVDVEKHFAAGSRMPTSLFLLTAGKSGERKSSVDNELFGPAKRLQSRLKREAAMARAMAGRSEDDAEGAEDSDDLPPLGTLLLADTSLEALIKFLARGYVGAAIASDEGGRFLHSVAMMDTNVVRTGATLSQLWDSGATSYQRAGEQKREPIEVSVEGQRLALSLQLQPELFRSFINVPSLHGQGLFARLLCANPPSRIGTRHHRRLAAEDYRGVRPFVNRMENLLDAYPPRSLAEAQASPPRVLPLADEAVDLICGFANEVERDIGDDGPRQHLSAFGSRVGEHATRLAAVVGMFDEPDLTVVDAERARIGVDLARYYLAEIDRASRAVLDSVHADAETLLADLERLFAAAPPDQRLFTPRSLVRRKGKGWHTERVRAAIRRLAEHGFLHPVEGAVRVDGHETEEAWWVRVP